MRLFGFGKGADENSSNRVQFIRRPRRPVVHTEIPEGREPLSGFGLWARCCGLCGVLVCLRVALVVSAGSQYRVG